MFAVDTNARHARPMFVSWARRRGGGRIVRLVALMSVLGCGNQQRRETAALAPEDARQYYPLEAGWRWAYDVEKAGDHILAIYAVVERQGDTAVLQAGEEKIVYAVLPEGIARRAPDKESPDPDFLLKSPLRAGARWPIDGGGTAVVAKAGHTVTVPAGTYANCVVVEESRVEPARLVRTTYAPGVGPVAIEYLVHDTGTGKYETALRASLRGATPPGADPLN
jgi:hypothetical protein